MQYHSDMNKPDSGIVIASLNESNGAVGIETFLIGDDNILTPQEAKDKGLKCIKNSSTKEFGILCRGIGERFKDYIIISTPKEVTDLIEQAEEKDEQESRRIWLGIIRELNRYTDEELNAHYEAKDKEWRDWCTDAVLFYAYNAVIFGKGVPAVEITKEQKAKAR
jgi:hypothetical protein